jgi:hypothetical protein
MGTVRSIGISDLEQVDCNHVCETTNVGGGSIRRVLRDRGGSVQAGHLTPSERTQKLRKCMEAIMARKELPVDLKLIQGNQTERCQR